MLIFSEMERTSLAPKRYGEPDFTYLDRSARQVAQRTREVLEAWLAQYPAADIPELVARLRSGNDLHFASASFEIFLHELMRRLGCTLQVHPDVPDGKDTRPDFLVTPPAAEPFYLEAVLATGETPADKGAAQRLSAVLDAINDMGPSDFYLSVRYSSTPSAPVPVKKMKADLLAWLRTLDADQAAKELDADADHPPVHTYKHGQWMLKCLAYPKLAHRRGQPSSTNIAALGPGAAMVVNARQPILTAVEKKASRYGVLGRPYLIAVNGNAFHIDNIDVMEALFGQEQFSLSGPKPRMQRKRNGAWWGPKGLQHKRVSAVLFLPNWSIWHTAVREACVYHHPGAEKPLRGVIDQLPHRRLANGKMPLTEGKQPGELLGLPDGWPGHD